jgi:hypothetical protein
VWPRGATRYLARSSASRFTGVRRGSPLLRPRTSKTREPHTLIPTRVKPAISRLKTFRVNQPGTTYRGAKEVPYQPLGRGLVAHLSPLLSPARLIGLECDANLKATSRPLPGVVYRSGR